jgi:SAM-dependent methyltransferase
MTEHAQVRQDDQQHNTHHDHADNHGHVDHGHGPVHFSEADWEYLAADTEREGEVLMPLLTDTVDWIGRLRNPDLGPPRRILDVGAGPGVAICELARRFPEARLIALDSSPAMLGRARARAAAQGFSERVETVLAEMPDGLGPKGPLAATTPLGSVDLIWASASLHHVGDEVAALQALRRMLSPGGLIAISELADPMRVLPEDVGIGQPGLADRVQAAGAGWFANMRHGLSGTVASTDLAAMVSDAGLEVIGDNVLRKRLDAPLSHEGCGLAVAYLTRIRLHLTGYLNDEDLATIDALLDPNSVHGVANRADVFIEASRRVVIASDPSSR